MGSICVSSRDLGNNSNGTYWYMLGDCEINDYANTTEAATNTVIQTATTLSNFSAVLYTNSLNVNATLYVRRNGANGNASISIHSGTTGELTDSLDVDSYNSGDTHAFSAVAPSGTGQFGISAINVVSSATGTKRFVSAGDETLANTSYYNPTGIQNTNPTESKSQYKLELVGKLQNYLVVIYFSNNSPTATSSTRINGVTGNCSLSITGTGNFQDTIDTDNISAGNLIDYQMAVVSGGLGLGPTGPEFATINGGFYLAAGAAFGSTVVANATKYTPCGGALILDSTESYTQVTSRLLFTGNNFGTNVITNTVTVNSTVGLRQNGATSVLKVSIGNSSTGIVEDLVDNASIVPADKINYIITAGSSGTSLVTGGIWMAGQINAGIAQPTSSVSGVGTSLFVSVGTASGASSVSGVGTSLFVSVGTASGTSSVSGVGASLFVSVGTASGVSSVSGVGASLFVSASTASGTSSVSGVPSYYSSGLIRDIVTRNFGGYIDNLSHLATAGYSTSLIIGSAFGNSTSAGVGESLNSGIGDVLGGSTSVGIGESFNVGVGNVLGTSTSVGVGESFNVGVGNVIGASMAAGIGQSLDSGTGNVIGNSTSSGVSISLKSATGNAAGESDIFGITVPGAAFFAVFGESFVSGIAGFTAIVSGDSTAAGTGESTASGAAIALGNSAINGMGASLNAGTSIILGDSTSNGIAGITAIVFGDSVATGIGASLNAGTGTVSGDSAFDGITASLGISFGDSASGGMGAALNISTGAVLGDSEVNGAGSSYSIQIVPIKNLVANEIRYLVNERALYYELLSLLDASSGVDPLSGVQAIGMQTNHNRIKYLKNKRAKYYELLSLIDKS